MVHHTTTPPGDKGGATSDNAGFRALTSTTKTGKGPQQNGPGQALLRPVRPTTHNRPTFEGKESVMSQKKSSTMTPKKGKAEGEQVTPERLRDFLAHPDVPDAAKRRAEKHVGELYEAGGWDTLPDTPEMFMLEFRQTHILHHLERGTAEPDEREIYGRLAALVDRHEPDECRLARVISATAYRTEKERLKAERGEWMEDTVLDVIWEAANEFNLSAVHPEFIRGVVAFLVREGQKIAAEQVEDTPEARHAWHKANPAKPYPSHARDYLRKLEEYAKGGAADA